MLRDLAFILPIVSAPEAARWASQWLGPPVRSIPREAKAGCILIYFPISSAFLSVKAASAKFHLPSSMVYAVGSKGLSKRLFIGVEIGLSPNLESSGTIAATKLV